MKRMDRTSHDHDADEEWTIDDIFVLRSLTMFIVACFIIVIYELYLDYLLGMFRAGLMDFLVFYSAREYRPIVSTISNIIIGASCFVFFMLAWREKHG